MEPIKSGWQKKALSVLGTFFLAVGILGVFLPLLPTTPFLLLSAACYSRSSPELYNRLMNHSIVGPYLRDWRTNKAIPLKAKILAVFMIALSFGFSSQYIPVLPGKTLFLGLGFLVALYLLRFPTKKK